MKIGTIWLRVEDGQPVMSNDLGRSRSDHEKENILGFLNGGTGLIAAAGYDVDRIDPDAPACVPIGYRTDGDWIWGAELKYYLSNHGVLPPADFIEHMAEKGYVAKEASESELDEALQQVVGR